MYSPKPLGPFLLGHNNDLNMNLNLSMNGSGDCKNNQQDKTKLIVNYIPQFTSEEDLSVIFQQIGPIENIRIMRNFRTGYSFGYGFVKYYNEDDAAKAIEAVNGLNFRNKRLKVSYSRPPGQAMKDSNLYISNLPRNITEKDLDGLFGQFGEIVQRNVLKDKISGLPRGVAFVRFSKGEEAQAAINSLDGKQLNNSQYPLSVRVAEDHSKQKAQFLEHQIIVQACSRGCTYRNTLPVGIGPRVNYPNQRNRSFSYGSNRFLGGGDNHSYPSIYW